MSDKIINQQHTIDELILDILSDEAQIIRCLRVFFCNTLQEIETERGMFLERKVKMGSELIRAAAKKEEALAKVLEAISLFEIEPEKWIALAPGESYPLPPNPPEISRIEFEAKTDVGMNSTLGLFVTNPDFPDDQRTVDEIPSSDEFNFNSTLVEILSLKNIGAATIYLHNLITG